MRSLSRLRGAGVTSGAFVLVAGTGFTQGGYFPGTWGWATLGAAWAAAAALVAREDVELSRAATVAAGCLVALTVWTILSAFWSVDVTQSALEAERTAVYAAALIAALLYARRRPERLLHGMWLAIVCICTWALATRLVPDHWGIVDTIAGYRLSEPIGYWNSLGLVAAMGALLALGIAAHGRTRVGRGLAAGSIPPLVTTIYFTYSRGSWLALGLGAVAELAFETRRARLLVAAATVLPWTAIAVWRASTSPALTSLGRPFPEMVRQGHHLVFLLGLLVAGSAASWTLVTLVDVRLTPPPAGRIAVRAALVAGAVAGLVLLFVQVGSPGSIARRGWHAFSTAGPPTTTTLNGRLFSFSGTGRVDQWRVAGREVRANTILGSGAGTFERFWARDRPDGSRVRDVHNLYLEMLAELGPLGLILLAGAFGVPLVTARRAPPLAAAAFGGLTAYLLHAIVDWDWEIPAVTLAALLCVAYLVAGDVGRLVHPPWQAALALVLLLGAGGVYTIATRLPLERLDRAAAHGNWAAAEHDAKRASALAPWSSEPWLQLGENELGAGRTEAARRAFVRAVHVDRRDWIAWYDLARASTGPARRFAVRRGLALNPLSPELASLRP